MLEAIELEFEKASMDFRKLYSRKFGISIVGFLIILGIASIVKVVDYDSAFQAQKESETNTIKAGADQRIEESKPFQDSEGKELGEGSNNTALQGILHDEGLLEQMTLWNGKALFVQAVSNSSQHKSRYYYYQSFYEDTNKNNVQDPSDEGFFNPASTVKVGLSALVLEKLSEIGLDRQAEYRISGSQDWHSFEEDIRRVLAISDNEATNRLILWLGFDQLEYGFRSKGLNHLTINRLMLDQGTLIQSPPFEMRMGENIIQQKEKEVTVTATCYEITEKAGNCSSATDLVKSLMQINQPEYFGYDEGFELSQNDREWMKEVMSHTPRQEGFEYADDYCRFLIGLEQKVASESGEMLSKCGVSLFTNTYTDLSYLKTDLGKQYYILLSVRPPHSVSEEETILWMNHVAEVILTKLP